MIPADDLAFLTGLGWSPAFEEQLEAADDPLVPMRIGAIQRTRISAVTRAGKVRLWLAPGASTAQFAVGDWVMVDPETRTVRRRLTRGTLLERRTESGGGPQLIAANVDTLFVVTSCNADFNPARLERYLALANEAGTTPVIVLTKADEAEDAPETYRTRAAALQRGQAAVTVNAKDASALETLAPWCGAGLTVALVGSSGVGKSTLLNLMAGPAQETPQETAGVREDDAKGRHTTTSRSLHAIATGGWVIDTPGIRSLSVGDAAFGIETLFAEITELAPGCRFRDCTHAHEPGCAVQAAVAAGALPADRLQRWSKLHGETVAPPPGPPAGKGGAGKRPTPRPAPPRRARRR
ncbi:MAG: ribosome biogenesis GTPase [Paracoccaceae bacterium]|jgi:ribosome biogenesis GTPase